MSTAHLHYQVHLSAGGGRKAGKTSSTALRTHVSYIARSAGTAVVRAASLEDKVAVARLATQQADAVRLRKSGAGGTGCSRLLSSLRNSHTIIHVTEMSSRLCGAVILRIAAPRRIFASAPIVSTAGRAFDPGLALRMVEHAVQCCQADGWFELRYFADFDTPDVVCGHFRRLGYDCTAKEAASD